MIRCDLLCREPSPMGERRIHDGHPDMKVRARRRIPCKSANICVICGLTAFLSERPERLRHEANPISTRYEDKLQSSGLV